VGSSSVSGLQVTDEDIDNNQRNEEAEVNKSNNTNEDGWHVQQGQGKGDDMVGEDDGEANIPTLLIPSLY